MANITVDIQAKIVGYEQSIKTLQAALAKVDPGSDIGKKLGTALEQAKKQFADLSKNMFPKASSDTQVDAIAEKVNRLGMSIQTVAGMFQSLNLDNLNLAALGPEITNIINQINTLQSTMDSSMNSGIREAVSNSTELSAIFKELGVNVSTMTAEGGMKSLSEGLDAARAAAAEAAQALSEIESKTQAAKAAMDGMKGSSPFLADDFHIEDVLAQFNSLTPEKVFQSGNLEKIQSAMLEKLSNTKMSDEARAAGENLIRSMISGVDSNTTLDEFKDIISKLKEKLAQEIGSENKASKIVTTGTGDKLFESLFGVNEGDLDAARTKLLALVEQFRGSFSTKEYNNVTTNLVNERSIAQAASRACNIISDAFDKVNKKYKEEQENFSKLSQQQSEAKILSEQANAKVETYNRGVTDYSTRIANLESQLGEARQQIAQLREQLEIQKSSAYNNMQKDAASAGANAGKNVFPNAEADKYKEKLTEIHSAEQFVGKLQGVVQRWFSVYAAVRMVTNAIKNVISTTKELDQTITEIAIVTNMSQDQLWGQMDKYTSMAKEYGASISGVYKVSQLYYQQGLGQSDVMALSAETLKMARISGLDYATATDYMTNAVRSFKLEMTDAQSVVDTYSAVAATSATSVTELATAMSKTASSAQAVGSSLQNTTAMMAVMIEATRESPENIGSAMKSIISRYGELKENKTGIDAEGEEYSLNKVDTALQSVGISIHDAKGEFRDFDDVIMELADSWDKIDVNTQRYIATVMAGNRQQSRFLALVSSGERLKELSETAADSEDAGQMQFLKTLDSIEYKSQQMKTSLQSLYADEGVQDLIKDTLDAITNIIDSFSRMSDAFNTPIAAIAKFGVQFANIARIVTTTFGLIKSTVAVQIDAIRSKGISSAQAAAEKETAIVKERYTQEEQAAMHTALVKEGILNKGMSETEAGAYASSKLSLLTGENGQQLTFGQKLKQSFSKGGKGLAIAGLGASLLGSVLSTKAMSMSENTKAERDQKALMNGLGSVATGVGMGSMFGPWGALAGGVVGLISGLIEGKKIRDESPEERTERLAKELETAQNENIAKKNEFKSLKSTIDEYEQLKQTHLDSAEAAEKYTEVCNKIAEEHPDLVSGYDAEGNAIINLAQAYERLKDAKTDVSTSEKDEADAQVRAAAEAQAQAEQEFNKQNIETVAGEEIENGELEANTAALQDKIRAGTQMGEGLNDLGSRIISAVTQWDNGETLSALLGETSTQEILEKNRGAYANSLEWQYIYSLYDRLRQANQNIDADNVTDQASKEVLKTQSQTKAKRSIGATSVAQSIIQERLLEDQINNTNKYTALKDFNNASVVASRYLTKKSSEYTGDDYFAKQSEADFDAINGALTEFWHSHFTKDKEKLDDLISNQGQYTQKDAAQILKDLNLDEDNLIYQSIMSYYQDILTNTGDVIDVALDSIGKRDKKGIITKTLTRDVKTLDEYERQFPHGLQDPNEELGMPELTAEQYAIERRSYDESKHFLSKLGESEKQSVISFYNNLLDMVDSKAISEASGEQVMDTYVKTWEALTDTENKLFKGTRGKETQQKLQTLLSNSDLSSEEGIQTFLSELDKLGITLEDLGLDKSNFDIQFPPNFAAKLQTYANEVATKLEDFEKDLKQATSGMDFSKASAMADKLGIKINKFRQEGNKFYLDDYSLLEEYYYAEHEERTAKLKEEQDKELKLLENYDYEVMPKNGPRSIYSTIYGVYKTQEDQLADLEAIFSDQDYLDRIADKGLDPAVFKRELIDFVKNGKEGQTFEDYMKENFKEQYDAYIEASDEVREYSMNSALLQSGQIEQFVKSFRGENKSTDYKEYYDQAIASGAEKTVAQKIAKYRVEAAEKWNADSVKLAEQISSGDVDNLDESLQEYAKIIYDTFHSVQSQTVNSILTAAKGGENSFFVTDTNRGTLEKMVAAGYLTANDKDWVTGSNGEKQLKKDAKLEANLEKFNKDGEEDWNTFVRGLDATEEEKIKWMEEYYSIVHPNVTEGAASKTSLSISEFSNILKANGEDNLQWDNEEVLASYGLRLNVLTGQLEVIDEAWFDWQEAKLKDLDPEKDAEAYSKLKAEIETARRNFETKGESSKKSAFEDIIKNYQSVTGEQYSALMASLSDSEEEIVKSIFKANADGTYTVTNTADLIAAIKNPAIEMDQATREALLAMFTTIANNYTKRIQDAVSLATKGTTNYQDMQDFATQYKDTMHMNLSKDAFQYDDILNAWTLDSGVLHGYIQKQAESLKELGYLNDNNFQQYVDSQTKEQFASLIDLNAFITAENNNEGSLASNKLKSQLRNYYNSIDEATDPATYMEQLSAAVKYGGMTQEQAEQIAQQKAKAAKEENEQMVEDTLETFRKGGADAVEKAMEITSAAGKELSVEDQQKFYAPLAQKYVGMAEQLGNLVAGQFVGDDGDNGLRSILESVGIVDASTGLVQSVENLASAYKAIYEKLSDDANATTSQLNSVYAQFLNSREQNEMDAISAMGEAMGMTYDSLGTLLSNYDIKLEDVMKNQQKYGIQQIGNGKIRIQNFQAFAQSVGLGPSNSEEYIGAFKAYNDSLIEYNRSLEQKITDEFKTLETAKGGDWLNVTSLMTSLAQTTFDNVFKQTKSRGLGGAPVEAANSYASQVAQKAAQNSINSLTSVLAIYGASLEDGILKLDMDANLIEISNVLKNAALSAGADGAAAAAQLENSLYAVLDAYVDAIKNGIKGTLNSTQKLDLETKAMSLGISSLDFEQTVEGFKLAQSSAIELYNKIKQIDAMQGRLVFDELSSSLKETNENYESVTSILNHMEQIQKDLNNADKNIPDSRRQEYEAELEVAREILEVRSTSKDDSFNFMSNEIPAAQNNPLNYYSNWADAIQKLKTAMSTKSKDSNGKVHKGLINYQDWYNIATEMNNIAALGGEFEVAGVKLDGSLEAAAELIQKGANALTSTDTGEIKVSLGDIGVNFKAGSGDMSNGIDAGLKAMAQSQIDMLDGLIQMLEAIVAMEELGDLDIDGNGIDLSELFKVTTGDDGKESIIGFNEKYTEWVTKIKDQIDKNSPNYNEDLAKAFEGIKIDFGEGAFSLSEILDWNYTQFDADTGKVYTSFVNAMVKAAKSGNYDLNNVAESVKTELANAGVFDQEITMDVGNISLILTGGQITTIDWSSAAAKALTSGKTEEQITEFRKQVVENAKKYYSGQAITVDDLETILILNNRIKYKVNEKGEIDKNSYTIEFNGKTYNGGTDEYNNAVRAAALADKLGINDKNVTVNLEQKNAEITANIEKTSKMRFKVTSKIVGGKEVNEYTLEGDGIQGGSYTGGTEQEAIDAYLEAAEKTKDGKYIYKNGEVSEELSAEAYVYKTLGYHVKIQTKITDDEGNEVNYNSNQDLKNEIDRLLKLSQEQFEAAVHMTPNDDGTATISIGSFKLTGNIEDFQFDNGKTNWEAIRSALLEQTGIESLMVTTISEGIKQAIPSMVENLNSIEPGNLQTAATALGEMYNNLTNLVGVDYNTIAEGLKKLNFSGSGDEPEASNGGGNQSGNVSSSIQAISDILTSLTSINSTEIVNVANAINNVDGSEAKTATLAISSIKPEKAEAAKKALNNLEVSITGKQVEATANIKVEIKAKKVSAAKGNIGNAFAGGTRTLMGELGPELVVSNGKYYVVGQSGAEFVDLDKDAIVFNHKQTERLFNQGGIGSRGVPFTNETNAISYAKGTPLTGPAHSHTAMGDNPEDVPWGSGWTYTYQIITQDGGVDGHLWPAPIADIKFPADAAAKGNIPTSGPAKASASAALATLKQLRSQWESLAGLSAQDLAGTGGGGGGGSNKNFLKDLEQWYNWLQKIATLEKDINYYEAERNRISSEYAPSGSEYYNSQKKSLSSLQEQLETQAALNQSQSEYFEERRKYLNSNNNPFSTLYEFDETGQLKYKDGMYEKLAYMSGTDAYGNANMTAEEQYNYIVNTLGISADYMKYNSSGEEISDDDYASKVQAFWDKIDADQSEMQSLYDNIRDGEEQLESLQQQQNELLKEMRDNQMDMEKKVYDALVDMRQRVIDELTDTKEAIQDSNDKFIDGLNNALSKEQEMYNNAESRQDLDKLRRKRDVLVRSGGSAAEISSLNEEIEDKEQTVYFEKWQEEIDAIQEASDKQIEKLEAQIQLETEILDYQKKHGLLWAEVTDIMNKSPEEIARYIADNNSEYWNKSPVASAEALNQLRFGAEKWVSYRDDGGLQSDIEAIKKALGAEDGDDGSGDGSGSGKWEKDKDGNWKYNEDGKGKYSTGWKKINDKWYNFNDKGIMQTGWVQTDGKWYYLGSDGAMLTGDQTIDGTKYRFGEDGALLANLGSAGGSGGDDQQKKKKKKDKDGKDSNEFRYRAIISYIGASGSKESVSGTAISTNEQEAKNMAREAARTKLPAIAQNQQISYEQFAQGGLVNYTGLAQLDGTKSKPEAVLNASQTKVLRDNILSNKPNSLVSLLKSYNDAYKGLSSNAYDSINTNNSNSTQIGKAEVNLNIDKLANDYDAKRAANTVMDEMLRIASKTGATNGVRR